LCFAAAPILYGNAEESGRAAGPRRAVQLRAIPRRPTAVSLFVPESADPMSISLADVHRIAHLARIEIDAAQSSEVRAKLDAIFAMINELAAVDTTGVVPMAHAQDVVLPLRPDVVTETDQRALYQTVAPAVEDGLYLVPRVVE
jgi:aspartyl-tRNA(Asn)/glutamyl-tRNA(Gln) amidotransferase subunit C